MPVVIPTSSAFRKYVRGVFETGCLVLYGEKNKGQKIDKKMYTVVNSDNSDGGDKGINK